MEEIATESRLDRDVEERQTLCLGKMAQELCKNLQRLAFGEELNGQYLEQSNQPIQGKAATMHWLAASLFTARVTAQMRNT